MRQDELRVGIAGYGVVGKRRRRFIDQHPNLRTIALCDQNFDEPARMSDGVRCFPHYEQLLEEPLDVLFVSLPNYMAADVTIAGLQRELHVFCEKPPGRTVADVERVIEVEKNHPGLLLRYGFNHRYHKSVMTTQKIIESGKYGEIINIRGVYGKSSIIPFDSGWRSERRYAGGGILLDQGIHMVDMIRHFAGDFDEIKSFVSNNYWRHDVEDNAYAIMRNERGCVAMLHSTATQWQHRFRLEITLTEALLELTGILSGSKSYGEEKLRIILREDGVAVGSLTETTSSCLRDDSWKQEIDEFADSIMNDRETTSGNSTDALNVMKLIYRIYCSDEQWKDKYEIADPDVLPEE